MIRTRRLFPSVAFALGSFVCTAGPASADAVADFFTGKTIRVVSAGGAGGAHGVYAHLLSGHIRKHIPGNPTVVMQFMPGAGGNKAMNFLFNATQDDGTWLGVPLQDLIFNARIGVKAVKYDPTKAHYLGGFDTTRTTVTVMKVGGALTLEDAKKKEVLMAASGKSGQSYIIPTVLNNLLGTKFRVVTGYRGLNAFHAAMERGEIHGRAASWPSIPATRKSWIDKDLIANLVTIAMEREPDLPKVPALAELVKGKADLDLIRLLAGSDVLGRAWIAYGGIPAARLAALRKAFEASLADSAFKSILAKRSLPLRPIAWQAQQALVKTILATPDATVKRLKTILKLK
jgi:tripartite-type tricarboxylate transporter receptor subunit TctC